MRLAGALGLVGGFIYFAERSTREYLGTHWLRQGSALIIWVLYSPILWHEGKQTGAGDGHAGNG